MKERGDWAEEGEEVMVKKRAKGLRGPGSNIADRGITPGGRKIRRARGEGENLGTKPSAQQHAGEGSQRVLRTITDQMEVLFKENPKKGRGKRKVKNHLKKDRRTREGVTTSFARAPRDKKTRGSKTWWSELNYVKRRGGGAGPTFTKKAERKTSDQTAIRKLGKKALTKKDNFPPTTLGTPEGAIGSPTQGDKRDAGVWARAHYKKSGSMKWGEEKTPKKETLITIWSREREKGKGRTGGGGRLPLASKNFLELNHYVSAARDLRTGK